MNDYFVRYSYQLKTKIDGYVASPTITDWKIISLSSFYDYKDKIEQECMEEQYSKKGKDYSNFDVLQFNLA